MALRGLPISWATPAARSRTASVRLDSLSLSSRARASVTSRTSTTVPFLDGMALISRMRCSG